jgi:3-polyprenyl-4-hydroxybenzoate decarboxylase
MPNTREIAIGSKLGIDATKKLPAKASNALAAAHHDG